ncbi:16S rRNA (guanine(966)-N(2))-methyltransferase RsmD [Treponema sp. OMZ 840]|uniref:16S rRNA (guanine(966)-N(2))-methyltransferase RsmD n=1 Tax=Treponema sp. OMZ 840 TaxID=244313 RepID=UPI003D92AAEC
MRITGGQLKGRLIKCPDGIIRPAMDKMRESFFSILGPLDGKSFLDLFSGSGIIALEAVSRGAECAVLCEKDKLKITTLLQNVSLSEKEMHKKIECRFMPVELFIKRSKNSFDIIFCDPPFPYKFHIQLIQSIADKSRTPNALLKKNGTVLIHRPAEIDMPDTIGCLVKKDKRVYGRSIVDFYQKGFD